MNQNDIEAMIQRYTEAEMAVLDGKSTPARFPGSPTPVHPASGSFRIHAE